MNGQQNDALAQASGWISNAVRRKPEALLLFAAGVALMMRGSGTTSLPSYDRSAPGDIYGRAPWQEDRGTTDRMSESVNRATDKVADYAGDVRDRVADTASGYASSMADYAEDARRRVGDFSDDVRQNLSATTDYVSARAQSAMQSASDTVREQPLLIAALGLAAGAAVAAMFPTTEVERRTLRQAGEMLADAADQAGDELMQRAGKAGEQLQKTAAERGLNPDGLKDMAREVADSFTSGSSGSQQQSRGPTNPKTPSGA